ncbi:RNA-binding domain-containing protein [Hypoxylon sp. EC38]|nr:RNA-binding domain-containing protein [Hypoxylon sp. EC38]
MHSLRRAAARAACSSSAVVAVPRQQVASFAMQISKANARPATMLSLGRYFSQTSRVAQEDNSIEESIKSARYSDSSDNATLESAPTESERARFGYTIFVSNMPYDVTDAHLREAFGRYGEIASLNIGRNQQGLSRGFGFITFKDKESSDRAVAEANKSFWHGRRINVDYKKDAPPKDKKEGKAMEPTTSLFIGNIPYETSDADLNRIFEDLDNVTDVRVAVDRNTGWPRGFAHADFADIESAIKAYEKLKEIEMGGRRLRVDYAVHRPARLRDNSE